MDAGRCGNGGSRITARDNDGGASPALVLARGSGVYLAWRQEGGFRVSLTRVRLTMGWVNHGWVNLGPVCFTQPASRLLRKSLQIHVQFSSTSRLLGLVNGPSGPGNPELVPWVLLAPVRENKARHANFKLTDVAASQLASLRGGSDDGVLLKWVQGRLGLPGGFGPGLQAEPVVLVLYEAVDGLGLNYK